MSDLMESYYFYSALLAVMYVGLIPFASFMCNPSKVLQVSISDLKYLTPYWVITGVYTTTSLDEIIAKVLFRAYAVARMITTVGYIYRVPHYVKKVAFFVFLAISFYMAGHAIYHYRYKL